jgi:predicted DNA-binding transcriptional regulator YafY
MYDTSIRRLLLLQQIPRSPHNITVKEICDNFANNGRPTNTRTIQRDLIQLSVVFPLIDEAMGKTNYWSWRADAEIIDMPSMNPKTALSFYLSELYLYQMMPPAVLDALQPHFNKAKQVLKDNKNMGIWRNKIAILPEGMPLQAPDLKDKIIEPIYNALLEQKTISASYQKREEGTPTEYQQINPQALVFRNRIIYLLATVKNYPDIIQFVLHRFTKTTLQNQKIPPINFNLHNYIQDGNFDFIEGDDFDIELLFTHGAVNHLYETPLNNSQKLAKQADGRVRLIAKVHNSSQLRWYIRGFAHQVEVINPQFLREEFKQQTAKMQK